MTKQANVPHVLVFDSGVGGLSVYQHIQQLIPAASLSYLSDNGGFPYGEKSDQVLICRCLHVIEHYLQNAVTQPDVIVIACNTASTLALPQLRQRLRQPIVGVVPAVKPAAALSANNYIGLLATPGTIYRDYTRNLIREFARHCHVVTSGSTQLVHLAEKKLCGEAVSEAQLAACLEKFIAASPANPHPDAMDCLVLACTHFPLLSEEISRLLGPEVKLLDSGEAIARRVAYWLDELGFNLSDVDQTPSAHAYFTQSSKRLDKLEAGLRHYGLLSYSVLTSLLPVGKQ
ncbi:glutamate racemase [Gilvimarinus sp. DA14]|uniref:glutamate racemase n=1 Tax=Gilvimarinus sp. DA14 TaxID=2956798 RepID=UPI0020B7589A|nr:glutamate racemase [Gilvimarinus sp. DA14]UTF60726.1 glutamate racemase [Gilvimarinus sp. DA14]